MPAAPQVFTPPAAEDFTLLALAAAGSAPQLPVDSGRQADSVLRDFNLQASGRPAYDLRVSALQARSSAGPAASDPLVRAAAE